MGFFFSKCHSWLCAQGSKEWTTFCIVYPTLASGHSRSGKQELWHPVISLFSSFYWNITEKRCQYILFLEGFQQCMNSLYIWPRSLFLIYNLTADTWGYLSFFFKAAHHIEVQHLSLPGPTQILWNALVFMSLDLQKSFHAW